MEIPGLKLIEHNAARYSVPDDPSYPYRLEVVCRPPEFMDVAYVFLIGATETVVVRAMTLDALTEFIDVNDMSTHPRLRTLTIEGPAGADLDAARAKYERRRAA